MIYFNLLKQQMNCWIELLIRNREAGANWTVAKSWTASTYPIGHGRRAPMLRMAPSIKGTLDGSTRPYPSWADVEWVSKHLTMFISFV